MTNLTFTPILDVGSETSADAWALTGLVAVESAADFADYGHTDLTSTYEVWVGSLGRTDYHAKQWFVVTAEGAPREPDSVLGYLMLSFPRVDNTHLAFVTAAVDPALDLELRRQILDALLEQADEIAGAAGRTTLQGWTECKGEPEHGSPNRLEPPTGIGAIDSSDLSTGIYLAHGWAFEQAERYSVLDLPVPADKLAELTARAAAAAKPEYELVSWTDHTPEHWRAEHARLQQAMSTDAPSADLEIEPTVYDQERLTYFEDSLGKSGRGYLAVAARHVASNTLAGFTLVEYPLDQPEVVFQEATLVHKEHRGHRLGMWIKASMLSELAQVRPQAARMHTWNAGENDYMLAINIELGFTQRLVTAAWQKRLEAGA